MDSFNVESPQVFQESVIFEQVLVSCQKGLLQALSMVFIAQTLFPTNELFLQSGATPPTGT